MVRRGSTVRVRQRALKVLRIAISRCPVESWEGGGQRDGGSSVFAATFALAALEIHPVDAAKVAPKVALRCERLKPLDGDLLLGARATPRRSRRSDRRVSSGAHGTKLPGPLGPAHWDLRDRLRSELRPSSTTPPRVRFPLLGAWSDTASVCGRHRRTSHDRRGRRASLARAGCRDAHERVRYLERDLGEVRRCILRRAHPPEDRHLKPGETRV
jgi:hypothetical protein